MSAFIILFCLHGAVFICVVAHFKQQLVWLKMHTDVTHVLQCLSCEIRAKSCCRETDDTFVLVFLFFFGLNQF